MKFLDFAFVVLLVLVGTVIFVGLSACSSATGDDGLANVYEKNAACGGAILFVGGRWHVNEAQVAPQEK